MQTKSVYQNTKLSSLHCPRCTASDILWTSSSFRFKIDINRKMEKKINESVSIHLWQLFLIKSKSTTVRLIQESYKKGKCQSYQFSVKQQLT